MPENSKWLEYLDLYHENWGRFLCSTEINNQVGLGIEPRDYTLKGIAWLLLKKRAMLTDEPGLGKTPQAALAAETPCLVACPSYLVEQWCEWIQAHMRNTDGSCQTVTNAMEGNRTQRAQAVTVPTQWTVVNKEMLRTHTHELMNRQWKTIIFDESHHLRSHKAEMAKAAVKIANNVGVERVYLLSATPIWKEPDDLFMQFRIMHPQLFKSYYRFVDDWCEHESTRFGTMVLGARADKLGELKELMAIMRYGRTYADAGRELPDVIEKNTTIEFPKEIREQYEKVRDAYRVELEDGTMNFTHYSQVLHTLRLMTGFYGKVETVCDLIEDANSQGALVFTWYKDLADAITIALHKRGHSAEVVHGDYPLEERVRKAHSGKHIVATIASLSEGIDLSRMDMVIFAEEHWPPGSEIQALRRVRRERQNGGNEKPIIVAHVHVKNTIDETIHAVAQTRTATIRDVVTEALV